MANACSSSRIFTPSPSTDRCGYDDRRTPARWPRRCLPPASIRPARSLFQPGPRAGAMPSSAWLLNCTARLGWLNRMTQFKEKIGQGPRGGLERRPVRLSGAAGGRRPALPGHATSRSARTRSSISNSPATSRPSSIPTPAIELFTLARTDDRRSGGAGDVAARQLGQDVEVGPVGHEPDQPDRRRRHDRIQKIRKAKTDPAPIPEDAGRARRAAGSAQSGRACTPRSSERNAGAGAGHPLRRARVSAQFKPVLAELAGRRDPAIRSHERLATSSPPIPPSWIDQMLRDGARREGARTAAEPTLAAAHDQALGLCA